MKAELNAPYPPPSNRKFCLKKWSTLWTKHMDQEANYVSTPIPDRL